MRILVTGGTGVIGAGAIPELLEAGHQVRLLSRGAQSAASEFSGEVEPFPADVSDPDSLRGAAEGCEVVVHITGIVDEHPPEVTYEKINVAGTVNMRDEASRAGVRRFVFLSSLGADTGSSEYHKSKLLAEERVKEFPREWLILRPGNVIGPGDDVVSMLLKMVRIFPVVPVVDKGDQPFQPIWYRDLALAIVRSVEQPGLQGRILELAGEDVVTTAQLVDRLCRITGRKPTMVPLPSWIAKAGTSLAEKLGGGDVADRLGIPMPLNTAKLQMLFDENLIGSCGENALVQEFGIAPTPLDRALNELADAVPEMLPEDGVGQLEHKQFWADIEGARLTPEELMQLFRDHITEIMPINFAAEPGVPTRAEPGATLTGSLPGRGNFQVRVEEVTQTSLTLATLQGHPLAGCVAFKACEIGVRLRFEIEIHARASNVFDWMAIHTVGAPMQNQNWVQVVKRMVELSGGRAPDGVNKNIETIPEGEEHSIEQRLRDLVANRHRADRTTYEAT